MGAKPLHRLSRTAEVICYGLGAVLCAFFIVSLAQGESERRTGIEAFEQLAQLEELGVASVPAAETSAAADPAAEDIDLSGTQNPDTSLWSPGRVDDYQASLNAELPDVLGVLEIDSVGLKVPVYATNTDLVMDRGAGIIDGMSYPHELGNIGISGHRDGYFRVLKDVKVGDALMLQTLEGPKRFRIDATKVVEISDLSLLQDTDDQIVTLVTCYPFYFVGNAPQRYIVTATLD
ncbi:MAG: class D sortase [Pseudomonadota bacterium]